MPERLKPYRADTKWNRWAEAYYDEAVENLQRYIRIPSFNDPKTASKEHPFGQNVANAFDFDAALGEKMGFQVDRCQGYCVELSYGDESLPTIDVYAHSDTVPVSSFWDFDPFKAEIKGEDIFGRGASDDKGPGLACLYGAKLLLDKGLIDGWRLRFIFGGNEELGCECLKAYFHKLHKPYPAYGISPDSDFPLIYAEKALCDYDAEFDVDLGKNPFEWGVAMNLVCDKVDFDFANLSADFSKAKAIVDRYLKDHKEIKGEWSGTVLTIQGHGYHGSLPWNGTNAALYMINILGKIQGIQKLHEAYQDYKGGDGRPFGGNFSSKAFDRTSYCVGKVSYKPGKLVLHVNMRLPEDVSQEIAIANVANHTKADKVVVKSFTPALYIDPKSPFIKTLMKVYREESGDKESKPLAIGGGTYSKESVRTVAFGGVYPGRDFFMHGDNEWFHLPDFKNLIGMYAHALYALGELAKKEASEKEDPSSRPCLLKPKIFLKKNKK